ncbi:hypothetical protein CYJ27_05255 [Aerococcus christensenii]|uniref:ECF transporter S component n=3 Tax=Aerococcus christensenii TaxID=87541 RepID=A0A120I8X9_9LACT|nr:hypothetical protein [Aerococcus christensenii]AMB93173.1 hypothetical protein AWM71_07785 [Aerococcus christensenii]MDK8234431.1 hypothetical protein [Aerococcus christensenii]PKY91472.1 hypothetical protein CYJ27_05255 [Aerococcus christensenii]WEB70334.1 hypothetical protein PUW42_04515 [Aerococcus christensenii]
MNHNTLSKTFSSTRTLSVVALLTAIGILVPIISPFKVIIGPFSWTLGTHIAIDLALFLSPAAGAFVALATSLGFFLAGFPLPIVFRAISHVCYVTVAALILTKNNQFVLSFWTRTLFNIIINSIHGLGELIVIHYFVQIGFTHLPTNHTYWISLFLLFGVSPLFHGMIDFEIAYQLLHLLHRHLPFSFTHFPLSR